jgi:tetrahydromethanopterin S-methyltransferase subunit G
MSYEKGSIFSEPPEEWTDNYNGLKARIEELEEKLKKVEGCVDELNKENAALRAESDANYKAAEDWKDKAIEIFDIIVERDDWREQCERLAKALEIEMGNCGTRTGEEALEEFETFKKGLK